MPLSSTEISQLNGAWQTTAANNMAYSGMIGQGAGPYGGGAVGDRAMGRMMSTAGAVGAPLAAGAMGLLGLDPMSIGLKAGIGAFGGGAGVGGSLMAGAVAAAPFMAAGAAASYVGGQMFHGAGQQQDLNQSLRSSFNFVNRQGGQGFTRSDMTAIGGAVREMTEQFGPGGEIASFRELTGLAGKMGAMGFAQGVRDVKDFTHRFKEMVKTLKVMATDLGTTLEGAMEFAQAAKGSGVFGMNRMAGFTSAARQASVAGGLALSEVTAAASVGSQISRSMGGLGRQGAAGGIKTIGQIGIAQQAGIISEEDIYNVTGQTGAEGRQAFAASAMQRTAQFLRSGRGRRMLASMAGKNGTLDEGVLNQMLSGDMSISETIRQDQLHVTGQGAAVSRANFIRNEGRLRGEFLAKAGGFGAALQLKDWAESKGIDINVDADRAMLFAQRQLGLGRDEADATIKMVQNLGGIEERGRLSAQNDKYMQQVTTARKTQGIQGIAQRFDQAKELINGKLQKMGQDIFNSGAEAIEGFMNRLMGTYVETYSKDIDEKYRALKGGGAGGRAAAAEAFGVGGPGQAFRASIGVGTTGRAGGENLAASMFRGGAPGSIMGFLFGESSASKLKAAGYDITGMSSSRIQDKLLSIQSQQRAAVTGMADAALGEVAQGGKANWLLDAYASGRVSGRGDDRIKSIEAEVNRAAAGASDSLDTKSAQALKGMLDAAKSPEERVKILANAERVLKISGKSTLAANLGLEGGTDALLAKQLRGGYSTLGEKNAAFAEALGIGASAPAAKVSYREAALAGMGGASGAMGAGMIAATSAGANKGQLQAAGAYLQTDEARGRMAAALSGDKAAMAANIESIQKDIVEMGLRPEGDVEQGTLMAKQKLLLQSQYAQLRMTGDSKGAREKFAKEHGTTVEALERDLKGMNTILTETQRGNLAEAGRRAALRASTDKDRLTTLGVMDAAGGLTATAKADLKSGAAQRYVEAALGLITTEGGFRGTGEKEDIATAGAVQDQSDELRKQLSGLSVAEKRAAARALGQTDEGARVGASAAAQASFEKRLSRQGGNLGRAAAGALGLDMREFGSTDLRNADQVRALLGKAGVATEDITGTTEAIKTAAGKGKGGIGELADVLKGIKDKLDDSKEKERKKADYESSPEGMAMKTLADNSGKANDFFKKMVQQLGTLNDNAAKLAQDNPEANGATPGQPVTKP